MDSKDSNYLAIGDVKIPISDTFLFNEIHVPRDFY